MSGVVVTELMQAMIDYNESPEGFKNSILALYGGKGIKAVKAVESGDVVQYLDFLVVKGKTGEYIIEEDYCTCDDFKYHGGMCWHILAYRIAKKLGTIVQKDEWYQDKL